MSQISQVATSAPIQKIITNPIQKEVAADGSGPTRATDKLELSGASYLLQMARSNDIRTDKVAEIRQQIEGNSYDADGSKLDSAIDKLLDEVG